MYVCVAIHTTQTRLSYTRCGTRTLYLSHHTLVVARQNGIIAHVAQKSFDVWTRSQVSLIAHAGPRKHAFTQKLLPMHATYVVVFVSGLSVCARSVSNETQNELCLCMQTHVFMHCMNVHIHVRMYCMHVC